MNIERQSTLKPEILPTTRPPARWTFLDESHRLIRNLDILPGNRVMEIGCGSGRNFEMIQRSLKGTGELTGVDSFAPSLRKAMDRTHSKGWQNVLLIDHEYGDEPIAEGRSDIVLLSFWLSTAPNWKSALDCARAELKPGGRIGVVDFCGPESLRQEIVPIQAAASASTTPFQENRLQELFSERTHLRLNAWFGSLPYYLFVGERAERLQQQEEVA
jgi:ubiquinone/menaquinone biosynthesis C-methylase UbiE